MSVPTAKTLIAIMRKNTLFISLAAITIGVIALFASEQAATKTVAIVKDVTEIDRSGGIVTSYADVLDKVTPAVVSVMVDRRVTFSNQRQRSMDRDDMMEDLLRRFYGMPPREREPRQLPEGELSEEFVPEGTGSGFIVSTDGYILTNNHVIQGRNGFASEDDVEVRRIRVQLKDGREYDADVVGADPQTDLAVLKIEATGLPVSVLGKSENLRVGDVVFAIGNPLSVGLTVSQGIVSALNRTDLRIIDRGLRMQGADLNQLPPLENFIQTDAAINMGNSGGPLVDAQGRVIGINSAISSIGGGSIGIGFAIPIDLAERVMQTLVTGGELSRGFIGVQLEELDANKARAFGIDTTKGVIINSVTEGLPGAEAGLQQGDVVTTVEGERVDSVRDMVYLISSREPGQVVTLDVFRFGEELQIEVTLGDRRKLLGGETLLAESQEPSDAETPNAIRSDELVEGLRVRELTRDERLTFNLNSNQGLLITSVERELNTSLRSDMVILAINGKQVSDLASARTALKPRGNAVYALNTEGRRAFHPLILE